MGAAATWLGILLKKSATMTNDALLDVLKDWRQVIADILDGKDDGLNSVGIKLGRLDGCRYQIEAGRWN